MVEMKRNIVALQQMKIMGSFYRKLTEKGIPYCVKSKWIYVKMDNKHMNPIHHMISYQEERGS